MTPDEKRAANAAYYQRNKEKIRASYRRLHPINGQRVSYAVSRYRRREGRIDAIALKPVSSAWSTNATKKQESVPTRKPTERRSSQPRGPTGLLTMNSA